MSGFIGEKYVGSSNTVLTVTDPAAAGDGYVAFFVNANSMAGDNDLHWNRAANKLEVPQITSLNVPLNLGTTATTTHALAAGDTLVGGKLEADGTAYFDSDLSVSGGIVNTALKNACDGYAAVDSNILSQLGMANVSIRQAADGYAATDTYTLRQLGSVATSVRQAGDGYAVLTPTASASDGYVCFFTGTTGIAGDNDLYWNRVTNQLQLGGSLSITNGALTCGGVADGYIQASTGNIAFGGQVYSALASTLVPTGTTQTVDWSKGNSQVLTLASASGDVTVTMTNPKPGASYILKVIQHATVAKNVIWPGTVLWPDSVLPVISTGASVVDIVSLFWDGAHYYSTIGQNYSA